MNSELRTETKTKTQAVNWRRVEYRVNAIKENKQTSA